jgi:phosphoglycerate dehydrogenase-like enzyme
VKVAVAEAAPLEFLEPVPEGVELVRVPAEGPLPDAVEEAEFVVAASQVARRIEEVLQRARRVQVIQTLSAGIDWLVPRVPAGLTLCNGSGIHDVPVSEWVVGAILAMERSFPLFWERQREARWERDGEVDDLEGKSVLILGHGSIGRAVQARLEPFGSRIGGIAKHPREGVHGLESLDDLLPQADIVVVLLPHTPETEGMADADFFGRMKPGALFVNASRGKVMDMEALERSLRSGHIRAALDVTDPEPLPDGHSLWSAPGLLLTPHVAGSTTRWRACAYRFVGDQIRRYAAGEPLANVRGDY